MSTVDGAVLGVWDVCLVFRNILRLHMATELASKITKLKAASALDPIYPQDWVDYALDPIPADVIVASRMTPPLATNGSYVKIHGSVKQTPEQVYQQDHAKKELNTVSMEIGIFDALSPDTVEQDLHVYTAAAVYAIEYHWRTYSRYSRIIKLSPAAYFDAKSIREEYDGVRNEMPSGQSIPTLERMVTQFQFSQFVEHGFQNP